MLFPLLTFLLQTAAVLALTEVRGEDKADLSKLVTAVKEGYLEKYEESKRHWGGGIMGAKANAKIGEFFPGGFMKFSDLYSLSRYSQKAKGIGRGHQDLSVSLFLHVQKIKIKISWVPFFNRMASGELGIRKKSRLALLFVSSLLNILIIFVAQIATACGS